MVTEWRSASDRVQRLGFGLPMSAGADTGRSGLVQSADRSTLELDVPDPLADRGSTCRSVGLPATAPNRRELALPTLNRHPWP